MNNNLMIENISLKECPFCHSEAILVKSKLWRENVHGGYPGHYEYYVTCPNNNCTVNVKTISTSDIYQDSSEAIKSVIEYWNRR